MRVGVVADIHCNVDGLERGLALMGDVDQLFCAGDAISQFQWSNEVVRVLRDRGAKVVLGNHEQVLLGSSGNRTRGYSSVDQELVEWLRVQPYRLEVAIGGKRVLMMHGSPWGSWQDYLYPDSPKWTRASELTCDTLIVGHTHFQMATRYGSVLVINPGSAGAPRDPRNGHRLSCAVWETESDEVTFHNYDLHVRAPDEDARPFRGGLGKPR